MKRIAIVGPNELVARELAERIAERPDLASDLVLLSSDTEEVGQLTSAGGAAIVQALTREALEAVDVVVACRDTEAVHAILGETPHPRVVHVASTETPPGASLVAHGINLDRLPEGILVSPQPATIAISSLVAPLRELGLVGVTATVVLPVTTLGPSALDDLFAQTRDLLSFEPVRPRGVIDRQLAFNLVPDDSGASIGAELRQLLETDAPMVVQSCRGGIFHGLTLSLMVEIDEEVDESGIRDLLEAAPGVTMVEDGEFVGPVDAASNSGVLVGQLEAGPAGWCRLWAVMDDLRHGGADNVIAVLEVL